MDYMSSENLTQSFLIWLLAHKYKDSYINTKKTTKDIEHQSNTIFSTNDHLVLQISTMAHIFHLLYCAVILLVGSLFEDLPLLLLLLLCLLLLFRLLWELGHNTCHYFVFEEDCEESQDKSEDPEDKG